MRVTTLKAWKGSPGAMVDYYAGLARDHQARDGLGRGPVDYYLDRNEPPGRWWGGGCSALGLEGDVAPEELEAMLEGRHPGSGRSLGRGFGAKSARGFDATFSAPKSVSAMWALSEDPFVRAETLAAHDTAVLAALEWFQTRGAVTRRGTDGAHQVDTGGVAAALFRQHTSRTGDPQLHTHAVITAKVQDATGRWLSLDARFLKYHQRTISWLYAAALRSELSARMGLKWGPLLEGHADIDGVESGVVELFSKRRTQVEAALNERVARWVDEHDGSEPDARVVARLERAAAVASRPPKEAATDAEAMRAAWASAARAAGLDLASLPTAGRPVTARPAWDAQAAMAQALEVVSAASATWLAADLAREVAALVPAEAASSAAELVQLVDELSSQVIGRCIEIHPPASEGVARRRDGRPVTEHVTDRRLTTRSVLAQETRLLVWARRALDPAVESTDNAALAVVESISGQGRLVLVVGPAGAGKTTALGTAVDVLHRQGRAVIALAPSGKAADVLARKAGCSATTLAKFLHEHGRANGPTAGWRAPAGTTVILDEAAMASTDDLEQLVGLVQTHRWRMVCVGDPAQLSSVARGGGFAHWCDTLAAHQLDEVRRFADEWQAEASLALRRGEASGAAAYAAHGRLRTTHPALLADRVARQYETLTARGASVAITTATAATARAVNVEIQRRANPRASGASVTLADGTQVFVGDTVATRRNDSSLVASLGTTVRNRHVWFVTAVGDDGSLTVAHPERGDVVLPRRYVTRHVDLGWAVTGHGNQGITADHGICVVEPAASRAGIYVAMTRGRHRNVAWIVDRSGLLDAEDAFTAAIARPASALSALAMREQLHHARGQDIVRDQAEVTVERLAHLAVPERRAPLRSR